MNLMQRSLNDLIGYAIRATDKDLGRVHDWYFDDVSWTLRYMVADTRAWLPGRKVLISPVACGHADFAQGVLPVGLSSEQIQESPSVDEARPVSRQKEVELARYYRWPAYWTETVTAGDREGGAPLDLSGSSLRSAREVTGYGIDASDGSIGHVEDLVAEEGTWAVRWLVVDTRNWLPGGRKVLVSPRWIAGIRWNENSVRVDLDRDSIKDSPVYDPTMPINRAYEERLYDYYGRPRMRV